MSDDPKDPRGTKNSAPFDADDSLTPEEEARWQRPVGRQPDRFPMLPDEEEQIVPLKDPPRRPAAPRLTRRRKIAPAT